MLTWARLLNSGINILRLGDLQPGTVLGDPAIIERL